MNAVVQREESAVANVSDMSGGLLDVIARAARDPNVDVAKMERLFELQERVQARDAKIAYSTALAELQPLLPVISERGKILNNSKQVQSTYAYWEDVNEAIRPLLAEHGFSLSFRTGKSGSDITVTGVLSHRDGHSEETTISLPADSSGSKNAVQAVASSTSYGKRYTAFALLNITTKGEDDDGQTATYKKPNGEPLPRTKLEGPHESKTALKAAIQKIRNEVCAAPDVQVLNATLKAGRDTIAQAERDWAPLITGFENIPEDIGLKGEVERRRAYFESSGMFVGMIASMKKCATGPELAKWIENNEPVLDELTDEQRRDFEREYEALDAGLRLVDTTTAGA